MAFKYPISDTKHDLRSIYTAREMVEYPIMDALQALPTKLSLSVSKSPNLRVLRFSKKKHEHIFNSVSKTVLTKSHS